MKFLQKIQVLEEKKRKIFKKKNQNKKNAI